MSERDLSTTAVHAGQSIDPLTGSLTTPIVRSAPFVFPTLESLDDHAQGEVRQYEYARTANPTVRAAELKIAALEGADDAIVHASGMAAVVNVVLGLLSQGDHVLVADDGYKRTLTFIRDTLPRWGISGEWFPSGDTVAAVRAALQPNTKLVFVELPSNPHGFVPDVPALATACHEAGALLAVDSTLASPVLARPLELGADLVIHSGTKYLAGHHDILCGAVAGSQPLVNDLRALHTNLGASLDAGAAYLLLRGLKTLPLRVERATASALALATWFEQQPKVRRVWYPWLESHPHYATARQLMSGGGGLFSVDFDTDLAGVGRFIDSLRLCRLGTSLGGVESLALHLGVLMRQGLAVEDRARMGLGDEMVRLAIGIEALEDLQADFERGLAAI